MELLFFSHLHAEMYINDASVSWVCNGILFDCDQEVFLLKEVYAASRFSDRTLYSKYKFKVDRISN